jgi:hypothetical protein
MLRDGPGACQSIGAGNAGGARIVLNPQRLIFRGATSWDNSRSGGTAMLRPEDILALTGRVKRLGSFLCFRFIRIFGF